MVATVVPPLLSSRLGIGGVSLESSSASAKIKGPIRVKVVVMVMRKKGNVTLNIGLNEAAPPMSCARVMLVVFLICVVSIRTVVR